MNIENEKYLENIMMKVLRKKSLNYTRSTVTVKPSNEQIQTALLKANANRLTESARMQFPKTENY